MFYILFLLILAPLNAGDFYSSDGLGRQGTEVEDALSDLWVLELTAEERRLYKEGKIYKRWVSASIRENGRSLRQEKYYFGEDLRTLSVTDAVGRLVRETLYDSKGEFIVENRFSYSGDRLTGIEQHDETGELLRLRTLLYRPGGSLRGLKSEGEERIDWRASAFSETYLDSLYLGNAQGATLFRYEEGRMTGLSEKRDDELRQQTEFFYDAEGFLAKEILHDFRENSRRVRYYDKNGNILVQNTYVNEILERSEISNYEKNLLILKEEQTQDSRKRWEYEYRDGEEEPFITRQYINGLLVKVSETVEEGIIETLYRRGEAVLTRIREDQP